MKTGSPIRFWAAGLLLCAATGGPATLRSDAQVDQTITAQLLGKAHALEVRGRTELAKQQWQQVLLVDPNNSEALAGMARAAKLEGKTEDANRYLDKMRMLNPNDPNIARVEGMSTQQNISAELREAGKLSQAGQYAKAMAIMRQVYGDTPPPGDGALSYYQLEAATEDGRPHAIAGLRALVDRYPQDSRYQVALGKILTYNPRTRAEGRKFLEKHPSDPEATEALRQSLVWDSQNPATSADIRNYLTKHRDPQLSTALAQAQAQAAAGRRSGRVTPQTPEQIAAAAAYRARSAEDQAAYNALNAKHIDEAETRFKAILANNATDTQALAGLGYVRMQQSNFGGAISYLQQAQNDGSKDPAVERALSDSRFYYTMQEATAALNENDLVTAQKQFQKALEQRNNDPEALLGLGGTLLKAQQPEPAVGVFATYVKVRPGDKAAWRGLFMAEYGVGKYNDALALDKRIPPPVHAQLLRDPDYLRTLASVYSALGRDADAQRVLRSALDLPFPPGAKGLKTDTQLQYAALLAAANHREQAAALYRQVIAADPNNTNAWAGLVQTEHALGQDAEALQTIQQMQATPAIFNGAMQEAGFETTVAAVYEGQGKYEAAQAVLEAFLNQQQKEGKKPFVPAQIQLAGLYLQRGNSQLAFPLYSQILAANPDRADAWRGLLAALHNTGQDQLAIAQLQQMPQSVRRDLENDPAFLQTVGSIYAGIGQPQEAMVFFNRVKQHYLAQHIAPPADIDIQNAWLLYNSHNDAALHPALMALGARGDLTDQQRRTVQTIWANFAVRRANQAADAGDPKRSLAILNAAAQWFPDNPDVTKALAGGYARAGLPRQAVAIYKAMDLTTGTAGDYRAAVGAALANNDLRDAEIWLRFGLDQYPHDYQLLNLAGRFESARGDSNRAADYYRKSLSEMPPPDPSAGLADELSRVPQQVAVRRRAADAQPQDLAMLLSAPEPTAASAAAMRQPAYTRPYLPGSPESSGSAPVMMGGAQYAAPGYTGDGSGMPASAVQPVYNSSPASQNNGTQRKGSAQPTSTLKDYVPQSRLEGEPGGVIQLHPDMAMEALYGPYVSYDSSVETPAMAQAEAVRAGASEGLHNVVFMPQQSTTPDGTPIVPFASTAQPATHKRAPSSAAKARAAAIRANQDAAPESMTGVSRPPADSYPVQLDNAQYTTAQTTTQVQQPATMQQSTGTNTQAPSQSGDSNGQQYPQPNTHAPAQGVSSGTGTGTRSRRRRVAPVQQQQSAPEPAPSGPPIAYPVYGQPLSNPGVPQIAAPYPLPPAPTDRELMLKYVPPLRSSYDPRIDPRRPLTEREEAEQQLATLEGSFSPWIGASVIGRYRSGTPGIDRLSSLEVPIEASVVINNSLRLSVIPKAVFLNSGVLDTTSGALGTGPILGTLPGNAAFVPQQQFASGVGGEFQLATNTFQAAIGYTPYEFLVSNVIGRVRWRPGNGHFTLYGGRDAVTETQLSYAGLRDPGSANATFSGNVWGGVVQTGGGIRFDSGNERAGLYIQGEGADLTGYHVLENRKYDGTAGAYFRVKTWPEYGSLNVGGTLYGEHFDHNERGETYGLGGYFSPEAYFLAAVPVGFTGHYGSDFHYSINGSVGIQTFQEDNQIFFPLNPALQGTATTGCTTVTNSSCGQSPLNSNTGLNYAIDAQGSYRVNENWYVGAFLSGNNTNNYNTVSGGFYARYMFRPQYSTPTYPTGLFPVESTDFRPLRVP